MKESSNLKIKPRILKNHWEIIYVVDDDVSVCKAFELLLKSHGYRVETFSSAEEFLAFKHPKRASCLILDIRLPGGMSGLELQKVMAAQQLIIPIIFVTSFGTLLMCVQAMQAGAVDFLPKPIIAKRLLSTIEIAIAKNKIQNKLKVEIAQINHNINTLSPRELEVFHFVVKGIVNKQIASKQGKALQTIKVHRGRVMLKMHAKTLTELIRFAEKAGINTSSK